MGAAATSLMGLGGGGGGSAGGEATHSTPQDGVPSVTKSPLVPPESSEPDGDSKKEIRTKAAKKEGGEDAARAAHASLAERVEEEAAGEEREADKEDIDNRKEILARKRSNKRAGRRAGKTMHDKQARHGRKSQKQEEAQPPCWPPPNRYIFEGGLRRVAPYHFTYNTWVKERWRGREILAVFESEFRDRPLSYYRAALESGTVTVNEQAVRPDHVLQNGQRIQHRTHRHEPPVTADPVIVIHEDADMLVINKPAGVPVHPAGRYQYNSVVEILKAERAARGDPDFVPYPCNRLDRLTSGIMFLAKSRPAAKQLSLQIQARAVRKEYLARVVGRFPDGEVVCDMPILQISPKLGLNRVRASGRSARTVFKRLAYYGPAAEEAGQESETAKEAKEDKETKETNAKPEASGYSIVRCLPVTGRTHQIRVHLQYLGHPIENDPIYANQRVWGFNLGRGDADATLHTDDDIINRLSRMGKEDVADAVAYYDEMVDEYHKRAAEKMSGQQCADCGTPLYTDPGAHELSLWLHSLRYESADGRWSYVSPLPAWALPPDGASGPTEVGTLDDLVGASDARGAILGEEEEEKEGEGNEKVDTDPREEVAPGKEKEQAEASEETGQKTTSLETSEPKPEKSGDLADSVSGTEGQFSG